MEDNKVLISLGRKLKEIRIYKGLTQAQLAHKIDKDREAISRLERGKTNPTFLFLKSVCDGLEISMGELFPIG